MAIDAPRARRALCAALLLLLGAACAHSAQTAAGGGPPESAVDRFLTGAARVLTDLSGPVGRVYFPALSANPNSGVTAGVLPVWLVAGPAGGLRHMLAPMLTYNGTLGAAFRGTYYYYPSPRSTLRVLLDKAERAEYRASGRYESLEFLDGRCVLRVELNHEADAAPRFFGLGPRSAQADEANYRLLERLAKVEMGVGYLDSWQMTAGWQFRRAETLPGVFPARREFDAALQRVSTYSIPRLAVVRDTRDFPATPGRGSLSEAFVELSQTALGSDSTFQRYGAQWRAYAPQRPNLVAAFHLQGEWSGGGAVPFTALATLGGPSSLRGFGEGRFQGRGAALAGLEERWTLHRIEVANTTAEFQAAPFVEAGTVFAEPGDLRAGDIQAVAGVGFRAVVRPSVVGKIDLGVGREGPALFVGVDYPF